MSKGKFAIGAILGTAAGFIAGIVSAPKSGDKTRAELKAKADKIKADLTKKAEMVSSEAQEVVEDVKEKAGDLKDRTERAVEGAKRGFSESSKK